MNKNYHELIKIHQLANFYFQIVINWAKINVYISFNLMYLTLQIFEIYCNQENVVSLLFLLVNHKSQQS